jgi:rhodanese-related sulfurtransferase
MLLKLYRPVILLLVLSMLLAACQPAAAPEAPAPEVVAPEVVPTEAPTPLPTATPVPPTPTPVPTDWAAVFEPVFASLPPDKAFGTVTAVKLNEELAEKPPFLLDVREAAELEKDGYIQGAVNISVRAVLANLDLLPAMDQPIVIYCGTGHRGAMLQAALKILGYENVRNLNGGLGAWKKAELPVETAGLPAAPEAGEDPVIADQAMYDELSEFFSNLPEGFFTVKPDVLNEELASATPFLLDVRSQKEYDEQGYIEGAVHIPFDQFFANLDQLPAQDQPVVVYCASGHRGGLVFIALKMMGYENVRNLNGGLNAWKAAQFSVAGWVDWPAVWSDFLAGLPAGYHTISAADLNAALVDQAPLLLDVRESAELEANGYIEGAIHIPVRQLLEDLDVLPPFDTPVVIYCGTGHRGALALAALRMLGWTDVRNLNGGLGAWTAAELPLVTEDLPVAPESGDAPEVDQARLKGLQTFLAGLPDNFYTVKPPDLNMELGEDPAPFLLDVRTPEELANDGYIEESLNVTITELFDNLDTLPADKAAPMVILCKSGHRGALALMALRMTGYSDVRNLNGGINAWVKAELPVVK